MTDIPTIASKLTKARDLLADEYDRDGLRIDAANVRVMHMRPDYPDRKDMAALRAIDAALCAASDDAASALVERIERWQRGTGENTDRLLRDVRTHLEKEASK